MDRPHSIIGRMMRASGLDITISPNIPTRAERENRILADALTRIAAIPTTPAQTPECEAMRRIAVDTLVKLGMRL